MERPGTSSAFTDYLAEKGRDELDQPFEDVLVTNVFNPFPEAVIAEPILAGRRKSAVIGTEERRRSSLDAGDSRLGTFSNASRDTFYKPIDSFEGRHRWDPNFSWERNGVRVVRLGDFSHLGRLVWAFRRRS